MQAILVSIGDELLIGQVVNTNASWLAKELSLLGVKIVKTMTIGDSEDDIHGTLEKLMGCTDLLVMTGGLGPTRDDITKGVLCSYFDCELELHKATLDNIHEIFGRRGFPMTKSNEDQALVPTAAKPLCNRFGTAPGMWFEKEGTVFVSLPGVPFEMKSICEDHIFPWVKQQNSADPVFYKTVLTQGVGESFLSDSLMEWQDALPDGIQLAWLPSPGIVRLRLMGKAWIKERILEEVEKLESLIPDLIYGFDEETLEENLGRELSKRSLSVATAESCTGGYIAHKLTSIAGASEYFKGSAVVYSNRMKTELLGVSEKSINDHGAVSEQVVLEMTEGILRRSGADCAIAISGVAGPAGGTEEKPVGTVYIGVAWPDGVCVKHFTLGNHRERNIIRSALTGMNMLRKALIGQEVK